MGEFFEERALFGVEVRGDDDLQDGVEIARDATVDRQIPETLCRIGAGRSLL